MRESVLGKTTRRAEDEGEAASYLYSCKAARAAPNRSGRAKPKEAAHRDVDYEDEVEYTYISLSERDACKM
jgi:hypothetical protein